MILIIRIRYTIARYVALTLMLPLALSCAGPDVEAVCPGSIVFTAMVDRGGHTKAMGQEWGNDDIGVYMKNSGAPMSEATAVNKKYSTPVSGLFYPASENEKIYLPPDQDVDFIAYYPYTGTIDGFDYPVDLTVQRPLENIDLLWSANATGQNRNKRDQLKFTHQLVRLKFVLTADNYTGGPEDVRIGIHGMHTKALFSLETGNIVPAGEPEAIILIPGLVDGYLTADALVLPSAGLPGAYLSVTLEGRYYRMDFASGTVLEKGRLYTYEITLNGI